MSTAATRQSEMPAARPESRPIRVLHVVPGEEDGPTFIFAKRQIAGLGEQGIENHVFYLGTRTRPGPLARSIRRLRSAIRRVDPDVVHAHYGTVTAVVTRLATRRPVVVTFCGSDLNGSPSVGRLRSGAGTVLSQVAALRADGVVAVSEALRDRLWWRRADTRIIRHGIDLEAFRPMDRDEARRRLHWPLDRKVVLMNVSRNPVVKRLDLAQAAVRVARRTHPQLHFELMQGDVPPDRVPLLMNAADVLVVTSDREGSPNAVKEAIACNLPVVSVEVGDVPERLAGVEPSRIVPREPDAIGAAIAELLTLGERADGHETIRPFSGEASTADLLRLYRDLLDR